MRIVYNLMKDSKFNKNEKSLHVYKIEIESAYKYEEKLILK